MKAIWKDKYYGRPQANYKHPYDEYRWHDIVLDDTFVQGIRAWHMAGTKCTRCGLYFEMDDMIYNMPPKAIGYYCRDCILQFTW